MKDNVTQTTAKALASPPCLLLLSSPQPQASPERLTPILTGRDFWPFDGRFNHWDEIPAEDHEVPDAPIWPINSY